MKTSKLAYRVLKSLSLRVGLVVVCASALSYWHLHGTIKNTTIASIDAANRERAERESVVFELARKNHELLKAELLKAERKGADPGKVARFDALLTRLPDGTIRNRREIYDGTRHAGVFIPPGHPVDPVFKTRIVTMVELVETYGKAFRTNFQDTYFTTPQNVMVIFWPESPNWTMEMAADFDMRKEEYVWVADEAHNPDRKTVWTGLFYDKVGATWMASGETPIYVGGRHLATVGHDVMLSELAERVKAMGREDGAYSLILRRDGRLVAHPDKQKELLVRDGKYDIRESTDPFLRELYQQVTATSGFTRHPATGDLLAQAPIHGPDWLLVAVFPERVIVADALKGIGFVLGLALLSLLVEMVFLYLVLEKEVNLPLQRLSAAADALRRGEPTNFDIRRSDELGQFAATFAAMSAEITERDRALQGQAAVLEDRVRKRTRELEEQRVISVQQAKMASLGEMAGGVAHEINNPLAIIGIVTQQTIDVLEEGEIERGAVKANLKKIGAMSERIAKIVRGLKTFSRSAVKDPMERHSLHSIVEDTLGLCREKMKNHGVELNVALGPDTFIQCRPTEISQVLLNLLNNAFDAVNEAGEKWVELKVEAHFEKLVQVRVANGGPIIPEEALGRIMQPFFTTKPAGKGTGLGLSIARGIADAHGGRLFVDRSVAHTCFVLELPKA